MCIDYSESTPYTDPHTHADTHTHTDTHTYAHTHTHTYTQTHTYTRTPMPRSLIREWVYGLHSGSNISFSLFSFHSCFHKPLTGWLVCTEEDISNNTSRFLLKRHFLFFPCFFILFSLQNMYRLFRTTTKIQYPIYMQFKVFFLRFSL